MRVCVCVPSSLIYRGLRRVHEDDDEEEGKYTRQRRAPRDLYY